MTNYQDNHPASLRPANQPPRSSQPVTKVSPTLRTSAVHDGSGVEAYHQGQEDHYLNKNKALPKPPPYETDPSAGFKKGILKNKQCTDNCESNAPYDPMPEHAYQPSEHPALNPANKKATARKPVAQADPKIGPQVSSHKRVVSAEEIGLKPPSMTPTEQVALGAPHYITTTADGKFDPRTIQRGPGSPAGRQPPPTFAGGAPPQSRGRYDPDQMPSRPTYDSENSSDATIRPSLRRQDSTSSIGSLTNGLKKMGSRVRRGSNEFFGNVAKAASLASKSPVERRNYEKNKAAEKRESARQRSAEREEKCQQNPELRPPHEREALRRKNFHLFEQKRQQGKVYPPDAPNPHRPDASEQVKLSVQTAHIQEQNAFYRKAQASERAHQNTSADDSTDNPPEDSPVYALSLSPSEREEARREALITRMPVDDAMDAYEKAGKVVGKLLDPIRRKGSDESDMFTGPVPEGAMDNCSNCHQQPKQHLKNNLCEVCHAYNKKHHKPPVVPGRRTRGDPKICCNMTMFTDPWQPSGRSTWPDSASDVEHGFMKLPGKRKMVKIRQTIYEDPGNPFQDELDAERAARGKPVINRNKALPEEPSEESPTGRSFFELDLAYDPLQGNAAETGDAGRSRSLGNPLSYERSEASSVWKSFRIEGTRKKSDCGSEMGSEHPPEQNSTAIPEESQALPPPTRRQYHRSMSLAIPSSPSLGQEYVSPRRFWRRENSLPLLRESAEEKEDTTGSKSARDTRFYGFYEDLMKDYDRRRSKL